MTDAQPGTGEPTVAVLFDALVDDAGLFPPEELPMEAALARHDADAAAANPVLTQRFLCPASRIGEVRAALAEQREDALALGVIAPLTETAVRAALVGVSDDRRLRLAVVEGPLAAAETRSGAADAAARVRALIGDGAPCHAEIALTGDWHGALKSLADAGLAAKVRCGGARAELFPTAEQLAAFVHACVQLDLPFKATAGLHHAVRYRDEHTGFTHHGFLNLLMAACSAVDGGSERDIAEVLRDADADRLAEQARHTGPGTAAKARRLFTAYGSCSTSEPLDDLRSLGLMPASARLAEQR